MRPRGKGIELVAAEIMSLDRQDHDFALFHPKMKRYINTRNLKE